MFVNSSEHVKAHTCIMSGINVCVHRNDILFYNVFLTFRESHVISELGVTATQIITNSYKFHQQQLQAADLPNQTSSIKCGKLQLRRKNRNGMQIIGVFKLIIFHLNHNNERKS